MNKNPNGAATDIEKLTKLVNEIQENFKMEKSQMESTISSLQAELESNKKAIEEEKDTVTRLDKMFQRKFAAIYSFCKMPERQTFVGMMNWSIIDVTIIYPFTELTYSVVSIKRTG